MITDKDIQKIIQQLIPALSSVFATKDDIRRIEDTMATKEDLTRLKSDVFNKMDEVYKEVKTMREEQSAHQIIHDRIQKDLTEIKKIPVIAHELRKKKN